MTDETERDHMAENELARRRRANQLGTEVAEMFVRMNAITLEFKNELQMTALDGMQIAAGFIADPELRKVVDRIVAGYRDALDASARTVCPEFRFPDPPPLALEVLITRLFAEAAKENGSPDGQAPALACFVTLTNGGTLKGVLSKTPEGIYRLMTSTDGAGGGATHFVEHFFDLLEISVVTLERTVTRTAPGPRIWPAS